jgi:hypothetical protein
LGYGGIGIQFADDGIQLLDYSDFPPAAASEPPPRTVDDDIAASILSAYDGLVANNVFSCELEWRAKKSFKDSMIAFGIDPGGPHTQ